MGFERIVIGPEVTSGVNPGAGVIFPHTNFGYGRQSQFAQSAENTPDLTPLASREVAAEQGGDISFELRLGVINAYLKGLFLSTFSTPLAIAGTISVTASDNSFNGTGIFTNVQVGQWVIPKNLHADVDNIPHLVLTKPSNDKITVATDLPTDRAGSGDETMTGSMIRRGGSGWTPSETTYAIEKQFRQGGLYSTDEKYKVSLFNWVNSMRFGAVVRQILTGSLSFIGRPESAAAKIIDPVHGVPRFYEGTFATTSTLRKTEINFEWNNNFQGDLDLGSLTIDSVSKAPPTVSATVSVNRASQNAFTLLDKIGTLSKVAWMYEDLLGQKMMVTLPAVNVQPGPIGVQSSTGTRVDSVRFVAEVDDDSTSPHYLVGAQIDYWAAP